MLPAHSRSALVRASSQSSLTATLHRSELRARLWLPLQSTHRNRTRLCRMAKAPWGRHGLTNFVARPVPETSTKRNDGSLWGRRYRAAPPQKDPGPSSSVRGGPRPTSRLNWPHPAEYRQFNRELGVLALTDAGSDIAHTWGRLVNRNPRRRPDARFVNSKFAVLIEVGHQREASLRGQHRASLRASSRAGCPSTHLGVRCASTAQSFSPRTLRR